MMAVHRLQGDSQAHAGAERTPAENEELKAQVAKYKAEAERVSAACYVSAQNADTTYRRTSRTCSRASLRATRLRW